MSPRPSSSTTRLLEEEGRRLLYLPLFNFAHGNFDDIEAMITSPNIVFGLSDAGAHCGTICDGSMPTSALTVWARDRRGGEPLPLELMVHQSTQRTAPHVGWMDRGVVAPGYVADLNVIDFDALGCAPPASWPTFPPAVAAWSRTPTATASRSSRAP